MEHNARMLWKEQYQYEKKKYKRSKAVTTLFDCEVIRECRRNAHVFAFFVFVLFFFHCLASGRCHRLAIAEIRWRIKQACHFYWQGTSVWLWLLVLLTVQQSYPHSLPPNKEKKKIFQFFSSSYLRFTVVLVIITVLNIFGKITDDWFKWMMVWNAFDFECTNHTNRGCLLKMQWFIAEERIWYNIVYVCTT